MPKIKNSKKFTGQIVHSSKLDDLDMTGKRVVIVGSGASAVEAAELAVEKKAERATILARHDKWFIPRNFLVDCLLACQPLGRQTPFSFVPEYLIRKLREYKLLQTRRASSHTRYACQITETWNGCLRRRSMAMVSLRARPSSTTRSLNTSGPARPIVSVVPSYSQLS